MKMVILGSLVLLTLACGCAEKPTPATNPELREAVDASELTLREAVTVAETSVEGGRASRATLLRRASVLSVGTETKTGFREVRVDATSGEILATSVANPPAEVCEASVSLDEAIAAAEAAAAGEAVTIAPDDDSACDREVKVLDGDDVLWEVKIGPAGEVKETEVADDADETEG